jgi:hypothetical protein
MTKKFVSYRERYIDLIRRHLGREPKRSDGVTMASLRKCERRLGISLPAAVRDYYLLAGRLDEINAAHNRLFPLAELHVDDGYLWFMEENQAVVHWGLRVKALDDDDPIVFQRANVDGAKWFSERKRFSAFLIYLCDWQAGFRT